jgi:hypothetical protein
MGFDAGTVVEPLDWDFTAFNAGQGTIPEPTDKAIDTMFKDLAKITRTLGEAAGLAAADVAPGQMVALMANLPEDADLGISDLMSEMSKVFAKLCSNSPSATQLNKLPMRIRMRFFVWLAGELRPEDFGGASMTAPQMNGRTPQQATALGG